jgi:hypothetical protein
MLGEILGEKLDAAFEFLQGRVSGLAFRHFNSLTKLFEEWVKDWVALLLAGYCACQRTWG